MTVLKSIIPFLLCSAVLAFAACDGQENGPEPGPEPETAIGSSISVPNETDATVGFSLEMESDWNITNLNTWFTIQPLSGAAGPVDFTVTVRETNPDILERVSTFTLNEAGKETPTTYYVIQDGTKALVLVNEEGSSGAGAGEVSFVLQSNVGLDVTSESDWITVGDITADSTLLEDDTTYSRLKTYTVSLSLTANSGEIRKGNVTVKGTDSEAGELTQTFTVSQMGKMTVDDWSAPFFRRSIAFRFTSTSCSYCPTMAAAMLETYEETDGRFIPFTMYADESSYMPSAEGLDYDGTDEFEVIYNPDGGYPNGVTNSYANLRNYSKDIQKVIYKQLVDEAKTELPSDCGIAGTAWPHDGNVEVSLDIASKEGGKYTIGVYLMENGIIYEQAGAASDYEHRFVVRDNFTDNILGDRISLSARTVQELNFSIPVPSSVIDLNNCYVCVWIARDGTFTGSVAEPNGEQMYFDYGMVIDNAVNIPLNRLVEFEYEN